MLAALVVSCSSFYLKSVSLPWPWQSSPCFVTISQSESIRDLGSGGRWILKCKLTSRENKDVSTKKTNITTWQRDNINARRSPLHIQQAQDVARQQTLQQIYATTHIGAHQCPFVSSKAIFGVGWLNMPNKLMAFYQNIYSNVIVTMSNKGRTQSSAGMMHIQCQSLQVESEQTQFCIHIHID